MLTLIPGERLPLPSYGLIEGDTPMLATRNPFYLMAGLYLLVDALAVAALALVTAGLLPSIAGLGWLRVHLLTIGVVTQVVLGLLPGIAAAKLGAKAPDPRLTQITWLLVNTSFVLLLVSMPAGMTKLAAVGASGILIATALMLGAVVRGRTRPATGRRVSLRLYVAGPIFFLIGIMMALSMLLGWSSPGGYFGVIEAHVHANVWGFLGLVVAGVLFDRIPARTGQPLRHPRLVPITSWLLIIGAAGLVAGPWLAVNPMLLVGIILYMTGTGMLIVNLATTMRAGKRWTPNLAHVLLAYIWMVVPAIIAPAYLLMTGKLPTNEIETSAIAGLVAGWILQIVISALPSRLGEEQERAGSRDGWWFSVVMLNLGPLAIWTAAFAGETTAASLTVLGYGLILAGWLPPLLLVLKRLFAGPGSPTDRGEPFTDPGTSPAPVRQAMLGRLRDGKSA